MYSCFFPLLVQNLEVFFFSWDTRGSLLCGYRHSLHTLLAAYAAQRCCLSSDSLSGAAYTRWLENYEIAKVLEPLNLNTPNFPNRGRCALLAHLTFSCLRENRVLKFEFLFLINYSLKNFANDAKVCAWHLLTTCQNLVEFEALRELLLINYQIKTLLANGTTVHLK